MLLASGAGGAGEPYIYEWYHNNSLLSDTSRALLTLDPYGVYTAVVSDVIGHVSRTPALFMAHHHSSSSRATQSWSAPRIIDSSAARAIVTKYKSEFSGPQIKAILEAAGVPTAHLTSRAEMLERLEETVAALNDEDSDEEQGGGPPGAIVAIGVFSLLALWTVAIAAGYHVWMNHKFGTYQPRPKPGATRETIEHSRLGEHSRLDGDDDELELELQERKS